MRSGNRWIYLGFSNYIVSRSGKVRNVTTGYTSGYCGGLYWRRD